MREEIGKLSDLISYREIDTRPGMPPDKYEVTYHVKGIVNRSGNNPVYGTEHKVNIHLHEQYPMHPPALRWRTPIWHPNIHHQNGGVCINQSFWAPSRSLVSLVLMMGEMIQGKNVHYKNASPYPLDNEAAGWYQTYAIQQGWADWQPSDTRPLQRAAGEAPAPPAPPTGGRIKIGSRREAPPAAAEDAAPQASASPSGGRIKLGSRRNTEAADEPAASTANEPSNPPDEAANSGGRIKFRSSRD